MTSLEPTDHGSTAIGLKLLADDYLESARAVAEHVRLMGPGPVQLLAIQSMELYFKAFLRARGYTHDQLRNLVHKLSDIVDHAEKAGLSIERGLQNDLLAVAERDAYVSARYKAGTIYGPFSSASAAIGLAERVRDVVRPAFVS